MFIFNGATCLCLGGLGTRLGVESSTSEENQILMLVEGNRRTHLKVGIINKWSPQMVLLAELVNV